MGGYFLKSRAGEGISYRSEHTVPNFLIFPFSFNWFSAAFWFIIFFTPCWGYIAQKPYGGVTTPLNPLEGEWFPLCPSMDYLFYFYSSYLYWWTRPTRGRTTGPARPLKIKHSFCSHPSQIRYHHFHLDSPSQEEPNRSYRFSLQMTSIIMGRENINQYKPSSSLRFAHLSESTSITYPRNRKLL